MSLDDTMSHIAGHAVDVGGRWIQRCIICGTKLVDTQTNLGPPPDVTPDGPLTKITVRIWAQGVIVEIKNGVQIDRGGFEELDELPDSICIGLVED
jgi:hypothetical protein